MDADRVMDIGAVADENARHKASMRERIRLLSPCDRRRLLESLLEMSRSGSPVMRVTVALALIAATEMLMAVELEEAEAR